MDWYLIAVGFGVGILASMVGVGGGFFIVPFLMMFYDPTTFTPKFATATSLAVVMLTASSSTVTNIAKRRIDYPLAFIFALATLPGAILGPKFLKDIAPLQFQIGFAVLLIATSAYLCFFAPGKLLMPRMGGSVRRLTESDGSVHEYRVNFFAGGMVSLVAGFVASMGGVGGGLLHMPILVLVFAMTPHIASGTSQFILLFTSIAATIVNVSYGNVIWEPFLLLGGGVVLGAQLGVRLAKKVSGQWLRIILACVVLSVAAKMVWGAVKPT